MFELIFNFLSFFLSFIPSIYIRLCFINQLFVFLCFVYRIILASLTHSQCSPKVTLVPVSESSLHSKISSHFCYIFYSWLTILLFTQSLVCGFMGWELRDQKEYRCMKHYRGYIYGTSSCNVTFSLAWAWLWSDYIERVMLCM